MNQTIAVRIPIDQRIYLLEELDAIPSTLSEKALAHMKQSMPAAEQKSMGMNTGLFNEIQTGHWLQILDDVNQVDGRILLITSNHPEKLDQRLLRPGRIDLNIDLGKASRSTIVSMIEHFTDQVVPSGIIDHIPDGVLSPASVSCIIQKNLDDLVSIVRELDMASQNPDQQGNECDGSQMTGDPIGINEEGPNAIVDRTLKRVPITSYQTQRLFG
jgi:SpoVK/Ycf46/Vps4 family AAA+-type ATPase